MVSCGLIFSIGFRVFIGFWKIILKNFFFRVDNLWGDICMMFLLLVLVFLCNFIVMFLGKRLSGFSVIIVLFEFDLFMMVRVLFVVI